MELYLIEHNIGSSVKKYTEYTFHWWNRFHETQGSTPFLPEVVVFLLEGAGVEGPRPKYKHRGSAAVHRYLNTKILFWR